MQYSLARPGARDAPRPRGAKALPPGFIATASTEITPLQMMINNERRIVGTQFHPEYWTDEYPDGRRMVENFGRWVGLL
ncbi:MAG: hypothetical protein R2706_08030 [Acidimicrobiales bacterium]